MKINLNFADIPESTFGPLPVGQMSMRVTAVTYLPARNKNGKDMSPGLNVELKPNVSPNSPIVDKKVFTHISFSPKALWKAQEFFEAVYQRPFDTDNIELDVDDLLGKVLICELSQASNSYVNKSGIQVNGLKNEITKFDVDSRSPVGPGLQ